MVWLAERIAALVVIILILRSWWHSQAWLPTAVVFVLNGAGRIVQGFALVLHLCAALSTPIGWIRWICLFLDWRDRHMTEWQTLINRPVRVPQPNRVDCIPR